MEQIEKDILIKCREGDKDAFRQVVMQYQRMVFSLALKMLCNEEEAKDTVQDTFVRVWHNHLHPFGRASHPRRLRYHRHISADKHLGVCGYGDCNTLGDRQLGVEINSQKRSKKLESHFLYFLQKKSLS
ncbi:MAG: sigma factor [Bacteroidales bacterium]|nr:sigma factor [Bacteroidales bacterium]